MSHDHQNEIQRVYKKCFSFIGYDLSLSSILPKSGRAYSEIYKINIRYGYISGDDFDHDSVYYMAEWMKKNIKNKDIENITQDDLSRSITDQILEFYKRERYANDDISILFLAANPEDRAELRLGEESRVIRQNLRLVKLRDRLVFDQRHSVRPEDISLALLETRPNIVHFSGHGTSNGEICFEDRMGRSQPASPEALAALFQHFSKDIICVLMNACYSEAQAKSISRHIDYVIGMKQSISDSAAIAFSIGFYQALGTGQSIPESFQFGCIQIGLQEPSNHLTPILITKNTISRSTD